MSFDPRVSIGSLGFENPRGEAAVELARLLHRRQALVAKLDQIDRDERTANEAVANASSELAELERQALSGSKVSEARRRQVEQALADARAVAEQAWPERRAGARSAVAECQAEVQRHVEHTLEELLDELRENGETAVAAMNAGASAVIDAFAERQRVEQAVTTLAAMIRPGRVGDVARSTGEQLVGAATAFVAAGGEVVPTLLVDPRAPRYSEPAPVEEPVA